MLLVFADLAIEMSNEAKWKRFKRRVEVLAEKFQDKPIPEIYSPRLSNLQAASPSWSKFYRLKDALKYAHRIEEDLHVFAVEPAGNALGQGKREFVTSSYEEFWFYYSRMRTDSRCFYEIIEEGAACHLYFDLEFSALLNPDVNGNELVDKLIDFVCEQLQKDFSVACSKLNVLRLDSTSPKKFSQHLIFHLPNAAFRSNYDVGEFVKKFCSNEACSALLVKTERGEDSIIDTGVYTKNRNFRLFLSTKKGKNLPLKRSKLCLFDLGDYDVTNACCVHHALSDEKEPKLRKVTEPSVDKRIFYSSLITNVKFNEILKVLTVSSTIQAKFSQGSCDRKTPCSIRSDDLDPSPTLCPYPHIHKFITNLVNTGESPGYISKWTYFPCSQTMLFSILGNRYCHNIGRQHKSNHVFYVADLKTQCCYQKCYDPSCNAQNFKSEPIPFSHDLKRKLNEDFEVSDVELLHLVRDIEENNNAEKEGPIDNDPWGEVKDEDLLAFV